MRYICTNCNHIYDEALGDTEEGYMPGVKLYDMQDFFLCPVCSEWIDYFQEITEEINYIDKDKMSSLEAEHFVNIEQKDKKINIWVWNDEEHPSGDTHYINNIALYDEYGDLVEEKFLTQEDKWKASFDDYDLDEFEVRVKCSIHWMWSIGKTKTEEN